MTDSPSISFELDALRQEAKLLQRNFIAGNARACGWVRLYLPSKDAKLLKRADFLYIVARERGFSSWPAMKLAAETEGLDRAEKVQRLKIALYNGNNRLVQVLLGQEPDLARNLFGLEVALYNLPAVRAALERDPSLATKTMGPRRPILHLAFSKWHQVRPELQNDMLEIANLLLTHGADVNDGEQVQGGDHKLSALYGAIGHAQNMAVGQWLLDHGADPNDGESLYHATELGHHDGLKMLLAAGANPKGTNALPRAMDFNDHGAVQLLLNHGASVDDFNPVDVGGEALQTIPALHQAARRMCDSRMVEILLEAGANPTRVWDGATAYAMARVFGNREMSRLFEARGFETELNFEERLLAQAAEGGAVRDFIDPGKLAPQFQFVLRDLTGMPERLKHLKSLVELGLPWDAPDGMGMTPIMIAGWEGLPKTVSFFLKQGPDLSRVNAYGGTLLGTILHGAHHSPKRETRDHLACLEVILHHGIALPKREIDFVERLDIREFLEAWSQRYPGQVT